MKVLTLDVPAMYGDHHVAEVRRFLYEQDGVEDVYASSAFKLVEISYNPDKVTESALEDLLRESGYLNELNIPEETGEPATERNGREGFFRHSTVYEKTRETTSFKQKVSQSDRPLFPCPGFGQIRGMDED